MRANQDKFRSDYGSNTVNLSVTDKGLGLLIRADNPESRHSLTIAANASEAVYQGGEALPNNFYGSAVVTTSNNNDSVLVTTNVISNNAFYSYTQPNQP